MPIQERPRNDDQHGSDHLENAGQACTMLGAAAVWIVKFGAPANAIIPAAILVAHVAIGFHGAGVGNRLSDDSDSKED